VRRRISAVTASICLCDTQNSLAQKLRPRGAERSMRLVWVLLSFSMETSVQKMDGICAEPSSVLPDKTAVS
jgi:hypothetical protein